MLSDQELIDLMDRAPAPMHVDLDAVVALGRRRRQRRRAVVVGSGLLAAAAAAAGVFAATTDLGRRSAGPDVPAVNPTVQVPNPAPREDLSGSATVTTARSSWTVAVERDVLTATPAGGEDPVRAGVDGAAWRVVGATSNHPEVVGVVPGRADDVVFAPPAGSAVPRHTVALAPAGDFTAFVATFDAPLGTTTSVTDVGWSLRGSEVGWALGEDRAPVLLSVSMAGEGSTALPPYDTFRTGPPSPSGAGDVGLSLDLGSQRLGAPLTATLDTAVVLDPEHLQTTLGGVDPESALGYSAVRLADGRTLVFGVLPRGARKIGLDVTGSARAGVAVSQDVLDRWTVYACLVEGAADDVTGVHASLPVSGRVDRPVPR